jgi:hypothetical protein
MIKIKYLISIIILGLFLHYLSGCKCKTSAQFGGIRAQFADKVSDYLSGGYNVIVCPNESVVLAWGASSDVTKITIDNNIGSVSAPQGKVTVNPTATTTYTLTASGSCTVQQSVTIYVINGTFEYSTKASFNGTTWSAQILPEFVSPNALVKTVKITYPTDNITWNCQKINPTPPPFSFTVGLTPTSPVAGGATIPYVGTWNFLPPAAAVEEYRKQGDVQFDVVLFCQ